MKISKSKKDKSDQR